MRLADRVGLAKLGTPGLRCICSKARGVQMAFDLCPTVPILLGPGRSTDCMLGPLGREADPRILTPPPQTPGFICRAWVWTA